MLGVLEEADAGGGDAVAGSVLDEIHGFVREVQQFGFGPRVSGVGGDTHARGDLDIEARLGEPHRLADQGVQAASNAQGVFLGSLGEENNELVSAIAKSEVYHAAFLFDGRTDFGEKLGTHQVAIGIVDVLKVIEIDEDQ